MPELTRRALIRGFGATTLSTCCKKSLALSALYDDPSAATWDLADLYNNDAEWERVRLSLVEAMPGLRKYRGVLGQSPDLLESALRLLSDMNRTAARLNTYAQCKADADTRVEINGRMVEQASEVSDSLGQAASWMNPEILSLGMAKINTFIATRPSLARFSFGFRETFRQAGHTLSAEDEKNLFPHERPPDMSAVPHREVTLSSGKSVHVDDAGFNINRGTVSRGDRKLLYAAYYGSYVDAQETLAAPIVRSILGDREIAHKRGFQTSLSSKLFADNIPERVYLRLVSQVQVGLPALHRYYDLQRRSQKLPQADLSDLDYPFSSYQRSYSLSEMRGLAIEALRPLGTAYVETFASATTARWMDASPRDGKISGNRTNPSAYDVHPYLLLNLRSSYPDLSLFTHEWGHAMHSVLARRQQPFETYEAPVFLQEIASTLNETLLSVFLVKQSKTTAEKLFYLQARLRFIATVFYEQAMLADFEYQVHTRADQGEKLSGSIFTEIFSGLMTRYYGPAVTINPSYGIRWVFYSNFFFNAFYLFQYSTSVTAAAHFARLLIAGGKMEREQYLSLLASGGSEYGYTTLLKAGVDLATPGAYHAIVDLFTSTLEETEELLGLSPSLDKTSVRETSTGRHLGSNAE